MRDLLIVCEYPTLNGGERSMLATLGGVRDAGFRVRVAAPPVGPLAEALAGRQVPLEPLLLAGPDGVRAPREVAASRVEAVFESCRPQIVHANSLAVGRLTGPIARRLGIASLAHLRDMIRLSSQTIGDLNCHDRILAVSGATRDFHVSQGLDPNRTLVRYNGVDLNEFHPRSATGRLHHTLQVPKATRFIGAVGQVGLRKGFDVLLTAAERVFPRVPQLHLVIIGERNSIKRESIEFEQSLIDRSRTVPLAGRVHFLGRVDNVSALLPELAMLAHPARQEPLGRVLLEAAASGVPVVATDVGGTREIFQPDASPPAAILVPADDPDALAEGVQRLATDTSLGQQLAAAARRIIEERFSTSIATTGLIRHYEEVLALRPRSVASGS